MIVTRGWPRLTVSVFQLMNVSKVQLTIVTLMLFARTLSKDTIVIVSLDLLEMELIVLGYRGKGKLKLQPCQQPTHLTNIELTITCLTIA